jgi:hypothetical protein
MERSAMRERPSRIALRSIRATVYFGPAAALFNLSWPDLFRPS